MILALRCENLGLAKFTLIYSHLIAESVEPVFLKADALMTGAGGKLVHLPARDG